MLASLAMRSNVLLSLLLVTLGTLSTACGASRGGKLPVDSPAMTFQAADVDEITGIDSDPDPDSEASDATAPDSDGGPTQGTPPASAPAGSH